MKVATDGGKHVFEVQVYLGGLDPNAVRVELYADGVNGGEPVRQEMMRGRQLGGRKRLHLQRDGAVDPPGDGLYGASDTALLTALRSLWKTHESCGSDDPIDGRKDDEESHLGHETSYYTHHDDQWRLVEHKQ